MKDISREIGQLTDEFAKCQKLLIALGDENRQHLILEMMQMGECRGVRVGEITKRSHLSRPAVSHHLQILREAGILKVRHDGTKNYYSFDRDSRAFETLRLMVSHAQNILEQLPNE